MKITPSTYFKQAYGMMRYVSRISLSLVLALAASTLWAEEIGLIVDANTEFKVDIACEDGTSQIGLFEAHSNTYLPIGSVATKGAQTEPTPRLLQDDVRKWVG